MSEALAAGNDSGDTATPDNEFKPIRSQEELNAVIADRIKRERDKFSDYKDVKAKAARLDEIEQANQTEAEKTAARLAEMEAELNSVRHDSMRRKIANEHGITDADDIDLFLTGADEETLTKQAQRLADRVADRKKNGNRVPREGATPTQPAEDEMRAFTRGLFGGDPT